MNRSTIAYALIMVALLAGCAKRPPQPAPPVEQQQPAAEQPKPSAPTPSPAEPIHKTDHITITAPIPATVGRTLTLTGQARVADGRFSVVVEDGHNELVRQEVTVSKAAPDWADFQITLDLGTATSPSGMIYFSVPGADGAATQDLTIPVSFAEVNRS